MSIVGAVLILWLPLELVWRMAGLAGWLLLGYCEIYSLRRSFQRCGAIRVSNSTGVSVQVDNGDWVQTTLLPGSIVTRRVAWLRLEVTGQKRYAELLIGNGRECNNWRRLLVLWRHFGAIPGSC